jgi:hypothetical protein
VEFDDDDTDESPFSKLRRRWGNAWPSDDGGAIVVASSRLAASPLKNHEKSRRREVT